MKRLKNKNILVLASAAVLCVICVILLAGSMGIYAERAGTAEWEGRPESSETEDALALALSEAEEAEETEETEETEEGVSVSESDLEKQWERMYAEYESSEYGQQMLAQAKTVELSDAEAIAQEDGSGEMLISLENAKLGMTDAGVMALKEIARLSPADDLEDLENLRIRNLLFSAVQPADGLHQFKWEIDLDNGYVVSDWRHLSYGVSLDAVSGQILLFHKFRPYQPDVDYSQFSWTDGQIREHAKELIEKYHLADGKELDWENIQIVNRTGELDSLQAELEEDDPYMGYGLGNTVFFSSAGKEDFYITMDWETGELYTYMWH